MNKPFIIPIFIPHAGCSQKCIFCDQNSITNTQADEITSEKIDEIVNSHLLYQKNIKAEKQLSFYGGNFLGLEKKILLSFLNKAERLVIEKKIDSIRFSTRPDTITPETLETLKKYSVKTIEIGAQSMDDEVLKQSARGHKAKDTIKAVNLIKEKKFEFGLQIMTGLPKDTEAKSLYTGEEIVKLKPNFVRIYPCIVLKGSPLELLFKKGKYTPQTLEQSINIVKNLYIILKKNNIDVIRIGLQASEELKYDNKIAAGPYHPSYGHLILSSIYFDIVANIIKKKSFNNKEINITVHPKNLSVIQGIKKKNIIRLQSEFNLKKINIIQDESINRERVKINAV